MWQISVSTLRRCPSLLLLILLPACSQPDTVNTATTMPPEPSVSQVDSSSAATVAPQSSPLVVAAPKPHKSSTPAIEPLLPRPAQSEPTSRREMRPSRQRSDATVAVRNRSTFQSLTPTFQSTQRMAGFSADGNYFLYLESSRDTGAGIPKSSLQVVDVASNRCLDSSCLETNYGESAAKLDLADAEQDLLQQTWKLRQDLGLTPPKTGTALAILSRSQTPDGTETVAVRVQDQDSPLRLRLRQKQVLATQGKGQDRAAMQLEVTYNGQQRSLDSLGNFRHWVLGYSIREVYLSPDGKRVAVLITAVKPTFEGTLATTLVQGFEL